MTKVNTKEMLYLFSEIHFQRFKTQPGVSLKTLIDLGYLEQSDISAAHKTHIG